MEQGDGNESHRNISCHQICLPCHDESKTREDCKYQLHTLPDLPEKHGRLCRSQRRRNSFDVCNGTGSCSVQYSCQLSRSWIHQNRYDNASFDNPHIREQSEALIPVGRIAEPEDIAKVVQFFLSDASDYINGTTLYVDGGYCIEK